MSNEPFFRCPTGVTAICFVPSPRAIPLITLILPHADRDMKIKESAHPSFRLPPRLTVIDHSPVTGNILECWAAIALVVVDFPSAQPSFEDL